MRLDDKLKTINKPALASYCSGSSVTIEEFYRNFIEPRLPKRDVVIKFHNALVKYATETPSPIYALRIFNENDETKIRRGFWTKIANSERSYFYTDNSFAYLFAKMAFDNDYPVDFLNDFYKLMSNHEFPYKYTIRGSLKNEKKYCAFPAWNKNPGITTHYKLAHIFDVGGGTDCEYWDGNKKYSIGEIAELIFKRGNHNEWKQVGPYYVREQTIDKCNADLAKRFLVAEFLRFVDPINYFLAPKGRYNGIVYNHFHPYDGKKENDIGEYKPLLAYIQNQFRKRYGKIYDEYLRLIMCKPYDIDDYIINHPINLEYDPNGLSQYSTTTTKTKTPKSSNPRISKYTNKTRIELAYIFLTNNVSLKYLEKNILKCNTDRHGATAKTILDALGISNSKKGILLATSIDDEINNSFGQYKDTLLEIKKMFHL